MTELDHYLSASIPDPSESLEDTAMRRDQRAVVERYLSQRPAEQQDILRRFYFDGQSPAAIAEALHMQAAGVKRAIKRGTGAIRAWMEHDGITSDDVL